MTKRSSGPTTLSTKSNPSPTWVSISFDNPKYLIQLYHEQLYEKDAQFRNVFREKIILPITLRNLTYFFAT